MLFILINWIFITVVIGQSVSALRIGYSGILIIWIQFAASRLILCQPINEETIQLHRNIPIQTYSMLVNVPDGLDILGSTIFQCPTWFGYSRFYYISMSHMVCMF